MSKTFLAFDLGASSGRAIIGRYDEGKISLEEIHRFANGATERDGHFFWNFTTLFNEIKEGIKKGFAIEPNISSIGIDTWGVDYLLFRDGKIISEPYCYRDLRTEESSKELHKIISEEELYKRVGIQKMNFNTIYQLFADKMNTPELLENSTMLQIPDAISYLLTGEMTSEYTNASTGALINPHTKDWDFELIDMIGLPRTLFAPIVQAGTIGKSLTAEICAELGVKSVPVIKVGSHDTASAVVSVPVENGKNWAYISCGTWALLGAELDNPFLSKESEKAMFTNEGGVDGKIRFLTNIMGTWLIQETRRVWNEEGKNITFMYLERMARSCELNKFLVNPNNEEFLTPGNMPKRIAKECERIYGVTPTDSEIVRCVYDSLAKYFAEKISALETILDIKLDQLHIVGGGTQDKLLMDLAAKACNLKVVAGPIEATAIGNILVQAMGSGVIKNLEEAREVVKKSFEVATYK